MINGNILGVPNDPTIQAAKGVWGLREQALAEYSDDWPDLNSPLAYVSSGSRNVVNNTTWNFTPGASSCVVVGVTAIAFFGAGDPQLSTYTFDGTNMTFIKTRFTTNYEQGTTNPGVYSWLLGITGTFTAATSYPIVLNVTGATSGFSGAATAMSFSGPVTGFGTASTAGGLLVPSGTTTASVTITSADKTSLIGFGARQSNSPALSGGTVRQTVTDASNNVRVHMSQVDNALSQTFTTTGGAVAGFALTY